MDSTAPVLEGDLLWAPRPEFASNSNMARLITWLNQTRHLQLSSYEDLWRWSVADIGAFWGALWDYFGIESDAPYRKVLDQREPFDVTWFEGSRVNYAEHLLRHEGRASADKVAIHHASESRPLQSLTWRELGTRVRVLATAMRDRGIRPGDRIVSYMPNIAETAIAMLATVTIGAVWSSAAPEFGSKAVIDRFSQIEPKWMFAADGYRFAGKNFDRREEIRTIAGALPSLEGVVWLPYLGLGECPLANAIQWDELLGGKEVAAQSFRYTRVESTHPLWVVYSSGTTGLPKPIVHGHVGILMEHLKMMTFHLNLNPDSAMFFYTTTGWVMFNLVVSALSTGASIVLYDGSPLHPGIDSLWKLAAETGTTSFGGSPTYIQMLERQGFVPSKHYDVSRIESMFLGGSPVTADVFDWCYRNVKSDLWVTSQSGGTEIAGGFVGASPTLPVHAGEIQTRMLGMDVHAWDDNGKEVVDEVGELVCLQPFPSAPLFFWNDKDGSRYHEAYFSTFPGVWRHGDFIRINRRGGCYIIGRSDSTLNRYGVRIGTSEIYRAVEAVDGVADSLIVCCELPGGGYHMPLFVQTRPGAMLDDALRDRIKDRLRRECSPRHVPDVIHGVEEIPYTLSGKKMEVPVRKILMGIPIEKAASQGAMRNPGAIEAFTRFVEKRGGPGTTGEGKSA